jgi:hypothetical protein
VISDGGSFGQVNVHVGSDWRVWCMTYPEQAPILTISVASTTVVFCLAGEQVGAEFAAFARELARGTDRFAAEAERLHAAGHRAVGQAGGKAEATRSA